MYDTKPVDADDARIANQGWTPGFSAYERCNKNWFRWFSGVPECCGNEGKRLQMQLRQWQWDSHRSYDLNITAEPPGELGWVELKVYGITDLATLEKNVDRLLRAWQACQQV